MLRKEISTVKVLRMACSNDHYGVKAVAALGKKAFFRVVRPTKHALKNLQKPCMGLAPTAALRFTALRKREQSLAVYLPVGATGMALKHLPGRRHHVRGKIAPAPAHHRFLWKRRAAAQKGRIRA